MSASRRSLFKLRLLLIIIIIIIIIIILLSVYVFSYYTELIMDSKKKTKYDHNK